MNQTAIAEDLNDELKTATPLPKAPTPIFPRSFGHKFGEGGMSAAYKKGDINYKTSGIASRGVFNGLRKYVPLNVEFVESHPEEGYIILVEGEEVHLDYIESNRLYNTTFEATNLKGANWQGSGPKLHDFYFVLDSNRQLCSVLKLDYIPGMSQRDVVNKWLYFEDGRAFVRYLGGIVEDVAIELQGMHDTGLSHRDVKHDNIVIPLEMNGYWKYAGGARLIDYGIARPFDKCFRERFAPSENLLEMMKAPLRRKVNKKRKKDGFGSYSYTSPEMARREVYASAESDVFSLGIVLWEALRAQRAFSATSHTRMANFSREDTDRLLRDLDDTFFPLTRNQRCAVKFAIDRSVIIEPHHRSLGAIIHAARELRGA